MKGKKEKYDLKFFIGKIKAIKFCKKNRQLLGKRTTMYIFFSIYKIFIAGLALKGKGIVISCLFTNLFTKNKIILAIEKHDMR